MRDDQMLLKPPPERTQRSTQHQWKLRGGDVAFDRCSRCDCQRQRVPNGYRYRLAQAGPEDWLYLAEPRCTPLAAHDRGSAACRRGAKRADNPYAPASLEFAQWLDGYAEAARLLPGAKP